MTTTKTKHTPEQWIAREIDSSKSIIGTKECTVAMVYRNLGSPVTQDRHGQGDANARLIASAPELLEALRDLLTFEVKLVDDTERNSFKDAQELARNAIAKAEGTL